MKKFICLTFFLLFITGCTITKVEEESFDSIIKTIVYKDNDLSNVNFLGYKFYLPRGTTIENQNEYNLEIKDNGNKYYLYIDTVSYYYKTRKTHELDKNIFYSTNLSYRDNFGYVDVSKIDDKYFIEIMYNYAKIEAYVKSEDLYNSFLNICYILSTIEFNDYTIDYQLKNQELEVTSEEFDIFKSKKDTDNFLQYIEEFDKYNNEDTNKDQDIIETEDN